MSDEENIKDPSTDNIPLSTENKNIFELQTSNMEVHKHPHHVAHKKKWTEYLLEFFMLFLAVFLGFVAENIREHRVESDREKEFMKSLLVDLEKDKKDLVHNISFGFVTINYNDSLQVELLKKPLHGHEKRIYHFFLLYQTGIDFTYHDRTVSQMKNTGGFRLIRNQKASDALADYDIFFHRSIDFASSNWLSNLANSSVQFNCSVLDIARIFSYHDSALAHITDINKVAYPADLKLLTYDDNVIHQMVNNMNYNKRGDIYKLTRSKEALQMNTALDSLIRKEYHLSNE